MTDNRTTELLREGLTERGIEWRSGLEGVTFVGDWCFVEYDNGRLAATCEPVLTPEQAMAATVGSGEPMEKRVLLLEKLLDRWYSFAVGNGLDQSCADYEEWCALECATLEQLGR